jgi:hypothetical protein
VTDLRRESGFPIAVRSDEVSALLGYTDRPVPPRVRRLVDDVEAEATPLLRPACAILRAQRDLLRASPFLQRLDDAVLCLVTIGDGVERAMDRYERSGEIGRALVMNVFGSAAAEATADAANALIRDEVEREGLRCTRRFSPGYGGWDVSEQRWLMRALEAASLGVSLTEGCMMVPRKSISFAVNVGENPVDMREDNACDGCGLANCRYRRVTVTTEENGITCTTFIAPNSDYCPLGRWS